MLGSSTAGVTVGILLVLIGSGLLLNPTPGYDRLAIHIPGASSEAAPYVVQFDGAAFRFWWPAWMLNGSWASTGGPGLSFVAQEPSGVTVPASIGCADMTFGLRYWYSPDTAVGLEYDCNLSHLALLVHES